MKLFIRYEKNKCHTYSQEYNNVKKLMLDNEGESQVVFSIVQIQNRVQEVQNITYTFIVLLL